MADKKHFSNTCCGIGKMFSGKRHYCSQRDTSRNKNVVKKLKIDYREKDSTPKKNVAKEQRDHFKEECDQAHDERSWENSVFRI